MKIKVAGDKLLEEFARFVIVNIVYFLFGDLIVGTLDKNAIINNGIVFSVSFIVTLISYAFVIIFRILRRSIKIEIEMTDKASKKNYETMVYYYMDDTHRVNRIEARVELIVTNSFWNWIIYSLIKKKKIELAFVPHPTDAGIECDSFSYPEDISKYKNGFKIDISETIISNIHDNLSHKFYVNLDAKVNRDAPCLQQNRDYPIYPYLLINNKRLNHIYKMFIKVYLKLDERESYIISYVYNN